MARFLLLLVLFLINEIAGEGQSSRLAMSAVEGKGSADFLLSFHLKDGQYRWSVVPKSPQSSARGVEWNTIPLPGELKGVSNPVCITADTTSLIFVQANDGQVYYLKFHPLLSPVFAKWMRISSTLPTDAGVHLKSMDTMKVRIISQQPYVFARSVAKRSGLFWCARNKNGNWTGWQRIGSDSVALLTDAAIQFNPFTKLYEAYTVMTDGHMYRAWQVSFSKWVAWTKTGYFAPKTLHAPVSHAMSSNFFNGRVNVFVHGTDGYIHHIWQTTCDKVPNPWGWCTWSTWNKIGSKIPGTRSVVDTVSAGNNIHLGIEIFTVDTSGKLYYLWQSQRDGKWHGWDAVAAGTGDLFANEPLISDDFTGWWTAYGLNADDSVITVQEKRGFSISPSQVPYAKPVKVSWSVPQDEATNLDWIGVYPQGASNKEYIDYYYVGGKQNPYKDAVPTGSLTFVSYLPAGMYDYRYLVNRRYVNAVGTSLKVTSGCGDKEWVQVYRGIFSGLHIKNVSVEECVKDAEATVAMFKKSFTYFEDREIYKGLNTFGFALKDVLVAAKDCGVISTMLKDIEKIVEDLVSCVEGSCKNFLIDSLKEILILYENIYEIYGDINGAKNAFHFNAYEQGGYCVGRVVYSCVTLR